jgi:hypothetical protein
MVDISSHFLVAPVHEADKSYDFAILASVAVFAVGLVIVFSANALSVGIDPSNLDLMTAFS